MAARSKSTRRVRWLVLAGLAGAGVWIVRSRRAGTAGLLEEWPAAPTSRTSRPATGSGTVTEPLVEPGSDLRTPPLGVELPVSDLRTPPLGIGVSTPEVTAAPAADVQPAADVLQEAEADVPAADTGEDADPPADPDRPTQSGQSLFSPPTSPNGTDPAPAAEPAAARPSPTPRPRPVGPDQTYGPGSAAAQPDGSAPGAEYTIKGNAGSMLFHSPDSPYYKRTKAEVWFRTVTDARAAGFTDWKRDRAAD